MATLRLTLLALVSFALFAPSASAIRVTNLTTGQILFQDNFESVPAYNGPYTSGSGDFDPVAAVGVWDMGPFGGGDNEPVDYDNQVVSSTTSPDPGPYQGSNYLRLDRESAFTAAYATFTPQSTVGHTIRLEMMLATSTDYNSANGAFTMIDSSGNNASLIVFNNGNVMYRRNAVNSNVATGLTHPKGEWMHVVYDYTIGESTYDLTIDGNTVSDLELFLAPGTLPTDVAGFRPAGGARSDGTTVGTIYIDSAPVLPTLTIDRTTGIATLQNTSTIPITNIVGYSLVSANGALDFDSWTTVAGNYDAPSNGGNGSFDSDEWTVLSDDGSAFDLSEAVFTGDGGTLAPGQSLNLGAAWLKGIQEDVQLEMIIEDGSPEGQLLSVAASFVPGSGGHDPFEFGDLDFDGDFDADDFHDVFVPSYLSNTVGLSPAQQYQAGDFNGDGITSAVDFLIFNQAYRAANPSAAALALPASQVPEPATWLTGMLVALGLIVRRRRPALAFAPRRAVLLAAGLAVVAATCASRPALAVKITNITTGEVLFYDNFDSSGSVSSIPFPDLSGDYDPVAQIGLWDIGNLGAGDDEASPHDIQVTNSTTSPDPGPFYNNYLRVDRAGPFVAAYATFPRQATPGDVIRVETMFATSSDYNTSNGGFTLQDGSSVLNITTFGNGLTVRNRDSAGVTSNVPGMTFTKGEWFPVVVEMTIGESSYDLTIDGVTVEDIPLFAPGSITGIDSFRPAGTGRTDTNVGTVYVDAIIENQLTLQVNEVTGEVKIRNNSSVPHDIDFYQITSLSGALTPGGWSSLQDKSYDGAPGNPKWTELGDSEFEISEGALGSNSMIAAGESISLGNIYDFGSGAEDLAFAVHFTGTDATLLVPTSSVEYVMSSGFEGDFNSDGTVDARDFVVWRNNLNGNESVLQGGGNGNGVVDVADYELWKARYGQSAPGALAVAPSQVPEPGTLVLLLAGACALLHVRRRAGVVDPRTLSALLAAGILAAATSAHALVIDRHYTLGDYSDGFHYEGASDANGPSGSVVTSTAGPPRDVFDSTSPFEDLGQSGNPTYAGVASGTYARPGGNGYGIRFDGVDDYLSTTVTVNRLATGVSEGMQMWVYPESANLGQTGQVIVFDSANVGGPAISASGHWTQVFSGHVDLEALVPVTANQWYHVAQHVYRNTDDNAPRLVPGSGTPRNFTSVLYVNGVAVSASNDSDLGGNNSGGFIVGAAENVALPNPITAHFSGVIDELEVYTSEANEFDLFVHNDWVANRIAQIPGGFLKEGDLNFDGMVDDADVDAFVDGWKKEKRFTGGHNAMWVGDWETLGWGDLNLDGQVNLRDALLMNRALGAAGAGSLDLARLGLGASQVPEPATATLAVGVLVAGVGLLRRR